VKSLKKITVAVVLVGIIVSVLGGIAFAGMSYVGWWKVQHEKYEAKHEAAKAKRQAAREAREGDVSPEAQAWNDRDGDPYSGPQNPFEEEPDELDLEASPDGDFGADAYGQQEQAEQDGYDLDCSDFTEKDFEPIPDDYHGLDSNDDGVACES
jgi:hypothetical protein